MNAIAVALALLVLELCVISWRVGLFLVPITGIVQEPLRKMVPGEPVAVVLLAGVVFAAAFLGRTLRTGKLGIREVLRGFPAMRVPLSILLGWLVLQHLVSLVRFQNLPLLGIGIITYFFPLLALAMGFAFADAADGGSPGGVRRYLLLYVALVAAAASGILLDYLGVESPLFEQVGPGIVLYDPSGIVKSYCGFFRSSEIAAWHIGTAVCVLLIFASGPATRRLKASALALVPVLMTAAVLTGRRKALMLVVLFISLFAFLLITRLRQRRSSFPLALLACGVVIGLYLGNFFDLSSPDEKMGSYLRRGGTVLSDAPERFRLLGVQSIWWALQDFGLFGVGAGVLGQGGQYFGAGGAVFGGSGEGGLGKITGELGLPGLALMLWLGLLAVKEAGRLMREALAAGADHHHLSVGLIALVAANVPSFIVASQAYGDPFVILTLGLFSGFAAGISGRRGGGEAAAGAAGQGGAGGAGEGKDRAEGADARGRTRLPPRPWARV